MVKNLLWFLSLLLLVCSLPVFNVFAQTDSMTARELQRDLESAFGRYELVRIDSPAAINEMRQNNRLALRTDSQILEISLRPRDLRSPLYRAEETTVNYRRRALSAPPVNTYKGHISGESDSKVRLTIDREKIEGLILRRGETFFLEPARRYSPAAGRDDFVLYNARDVLHKVSFTCRQTHLHEQVSETVDRVFPLIGRAQLIPPPTVQIIEIATEADFEYVTVTGGPIQANLEILGILNAIEGIYETQLSLTFNVTFQHVWTTSDPYTASTIEGLLFAFRDYWNANFPVSVAPRDVANMWTNKPNFSGNNAQGRAFLGVVCRSAAASYSVTGRRPETFAFNVNYLLAAHEIGHTLGANHVDGTQNCDNSIMNASVSNLTPLNFCEASRGEIRRYIAANGGCLLPRALIKTQFDFDGDDKTDRAVFRPSSGVWFILNSGAINVTGLQFGANGDRPVPADYDGDGHADIAVFRPSGGTWFILYSGGNRFIGVQFGLSTDIPVPGDYDGDGRYDVAVFRPSNGDWYTLSLVSNAFTATQFGANGDIPAPSSYVR